MFFLVKNFLYSQIDIQTIKYLTVRPPAGLSFGELLFGSTRIIPTSPGLALVHLQTFPEKQASLAIIDIIRHPDESTHMQEIIHNSGNYPALKKDLKPRVDLQPFAIERVVDSELQSQESKKTQNLLIFQIGILQPPFIQDFRKFILQPVIGLIVKIGIVIPDLFDRAAIVQKINFITDWIWIKFRDQIFDDKHQSSIGHKYQLDQRPIVANNFFQINLEDYKWVLFVLIGVIISSAEKPKLPID